MPYATLQQLIVRVGEPLLIQISDRTGAGQVDADVVADAIARAEATIDASLAVRYRLPLDTVPAVVEDIAAAIAVYRLHVVTPEQKIKDEYDQALRDLRDIADGRKRLDVAGIEPTTSGASGVVTIDRERPMTPESLRGFI